MVCKLCPDGSTRGNLKGILAGNAKKHLSYHRNVEHEDVVARDSNRTTVAVTSVGSRKEETPKYANPIEAAQHKCRSLWNVRAQKRNLACFLAKPTVPIGVVEDKAFRRFIYGFDKRYQVPKSGGGAKTVLACQATATKEALKKRIQLARSKFSVVVDIWSVSRSAYAGVTMHFVGSGGRLEVCFLGVREFEGVKAAERVRECVNSILREFQLSDNDVAFYVTDNGTRWKKFTVVSDDYADTPGPMNPTTKTATPNSNRIRATYADPQIEETDCQDDSDQEEDAQAADVKEFEAVGREYDVTFAKRVSCFDHCLELVLKKVV